MAYEEQWRRRRRLLIMREAREAYLIQETVNGWQPRTRMWRRWQAGNHAIDDPVAGMPSRV